MDYCSTCRRHLNGALVCPGCGAYAPDIAPGLVDGRPVPGPATGAAPGGAVPPSWEVAAPEVSYETPGDGHPEPCDGGEDTVAPVPLPRGRAARRRQMARWKKNQRRAVVATAVALVGGGLTFASMDRSTGDRAQAATAPDPRSMGVAEEPAQDYTPPAPDQPTPRAAAPDRSDRSRTADTPGRAAAPAAPAPASTPSSPRQDSVTAPQQRQVTEPRQQPRTSTPQGSVPTAPDSTDTAQPEQAAPAPTAPAASGDGTSQQGSQPSTTTPGSTTPQQDQLCLLVVCLG
ncbi:hypothetical protein AB0K80_10680 [Streptomyces sp. NPDC052682]|uniref:SCO2400 family protein n=1 Tax=Streptomyces sp. NPDC052682 TaxID=3154954 RepID=UPI003433E6BD